MYRCIHYQLFLLFWSQNSICPCWPKALPNLILSYVVVMEVVRMVIKQYNGLILFKIIFLFFFLVRYCGTARYKGVPRCGRLINYSQSFQTFRIMNHPVLNKMFCVCSSDRETSYVGCSCYVRKCAACISNWTTQCDRWLCRCLLWKLIF